MFFNFFNMSGDGGKRLESEKIKSKIKNNLYFLRFLQMIFYFCSSNSVRCCFGNETRTFFFVFVFVLKKIFVVD